MLKTVDKPLDSTTINTIELEEYKALRAEILTYISSKHNLIYLSVLVILALLGIQITTEMCVFTFCANCAIIVFYNQDLKYKIGIAECGAYIRARFEDSSNDFYWETALAEINKKYDDRKKLLISKKFKKSFKSIYDINGYDNFTVFPLISLFTGWYSLMKKFLTAEGFNEGFWKIESINAVILGISAAIAVGFYFRMYFESKDDFNRKRADFYTKIKLMFSKRWNTIK